MTNSVSRFSGVAGPQLNRNLLLCALPDEVQHRLAGMLRFTSIGKRQTILKQGQPLSSIYFLNQGIVGLSVTMDDGKTSEIAQVGYEGFVGHDAVFDNNVLASYDASPHQAIDSAYALSIAAFRAELDRRGAFFDVISQYMGRFTRRLVQSVACASLHSAQERCCRWLMERSVQSGQAAMYITQDAIADALGLRRPTVTLLLNCLVEDGILAMSRGRIEIIKASELEALSCECYRIGRV